MLMNKAKTRRMLGWHWIAWDRIGIAAVERDGVSNVRPGAWYYDAMYVFDGTDQEHVRPGCDCDNSSTDVVFRLRKAIHHPSFHRIYPLSCPGW
jgi:hypothetical protein